MKSSVESKIHVGNARSVAARLSVSGPSSMVQMYMQFKQLVKSLELKGIPEQLPVSINGTSFVPHL